MKKMSFIIISLFVLAGSAQSVSLSPETVNGMYHLTVPERGQKKVLVQYGQLGGKTVIAVAACKKCVPMIYSYLDEESKTLGESIFYSSAGLYLFYSKQGNFIVVQPDGVLGRKIWKNIRHANLYSKSQSTAQGVPIASLKKYAIDLSSKIMKVTVGTMAHASGTYHLAVPKNHLGKSISSYQIDFNNSGKKSIFVNPCDRCPKSTYNHLAEESAIAGVDIYINSSSHYIFDLKDGVLIYTFANASGLGKTLWKKSSRYNVYSNNKAYIRQIIQSKKKQEMIDKMMERFFSEIRAEKLRQIDEKQKTAVANRKLPKEIKINQDKKDLLRAAQYWADAWNWVESLKTAYVTQNDWSITRNKLTGVITGKLIRGLVTMTHPDGRCRYQILVFRKDFNGSRYMNLHVTGVGTIYDLKCNQI